MNPSPASLRSDRRSLTLEIGDHLDWIAHPGVGVLGATEAVACVFRSKPITELYGRMWFAPAMQ